MATQYTEEFKKITKEKTTSRMSLYEQWLDEVYRRSKLGQFWDYCSDIETYIGRLT